MIKLYNSLTNRIEEFKPIKKNTVMMYVCGSTVYNNMHIGNSRPIIFFDVVNRFFRYLGYDVFMVSNFTDIDDKIINKARELNITESEVSEKYIKEILETYKSLNCLPHYKNPKVTDNMDDIIKFIDELVNKDGAYVVDGDVYFDVNKVEDYGVLSGQSKENLISGARIEENEKKKQAVDFNLWKKTKDGLKWDSPWSEGRPGWHTECVVMVNKIFKGKIDIHGGGVELKFPHHDNEIAQSEVMHNHHLANYWMHNGSIDMGGEKMSKSIGNIIMADDLVKRVGYPVYRLMILNVPYRQPLNYKEDLIIQTSKDYEKINRAYVGLFRKLQIEYGVTEYKGIIASSDLVDLKEEFIREMSNDFNAANGLTVIFKLVKIMNSLVRSKDLNIEYVKEVLTLYNEFTWVLGIDEEILPLEESELSLVKLWQEARINKDFDKADMYRKEISKLGITL
ncbi:MAG: cysteine--tRNA ligase [Bacilli bacterium]